MENYLEILENCRNYNKELKQDLQLVTKKLFVADKTSKEINKEFGQIVKRLEELSEVIGEGENELNNIATHGVIYIATIFLAFSSFHFLGPSVIIYFLIATLLEGLSFFYKEYKNKKHYQTLRAKNAQAILDEKEKLAVLEEKRRENSHRRRSYLEEKYSLEEKIGEQQAIVAEIMGHLAPLLDDLIANNNLDLENLDETITQLAPKK